MVASVQTSGSISCSIERPRHAGPADDGSNRDAPGRRCRSCRRERLGRQRRKIVVFPASPAYSVGIPSGRAGGRSCLKGAAMRMCAGWLVALLVLVATGSLYSDESKGWVELFNGKDTTGWKLRSAKTTVTRFVGPEGKPIADARRGKIDQKEEARDEKNKTIEGAKIVEKDGKKVVVDADGKVIAKAKIAKVGGRDAILDKKGDEIKGAKAITETADNQSGWTVEGDTLVCSKPHGGNDLL